MCFDIICWHGEKLWQLLGRKQQGVSGEAVKKSTGHRC